jgi:hypothetical protein
MIIEYDKLCEERKCDCKDHQIQNLRRGNRRE